MARSILLVEDHPLLRLALAALLRDVAPGHAVHEAATLRRGIELAASLQGLALVVYDWGLPDGGGLQGLIAVRSKAQHAGIVVMSGSAEPAVEVVSLESGACAYLPKSASPAEIKRVLGHALAAPAAAHAAAPVLAKLTPRQRDVARLVAAGRSNKEAAVLLGIAEATVRDHVSEILSLLNVHHRAEAAVLLARASGW